MADRESNWQVDLTHIALTDVGMRRANNQDSMTVVLASDKDEWRERGHFFMVADGMGAHAAGELASKIAVDGVPHLYRKYRELSPPEAMQKAMQKTPLYIHLTVTFLKEQMVILIHMHLLVHQKWLLQ